MNPLMAAMGGGGMPMGGMGMAGCGPGDMGGMQGSQQQPYPETPQFDLQSLLAQFPGLTPQMLLQLVAQTSQPMEEAGEAQQGGMGMGGGQNPLMAMLMQTGQMPPQSMSPQGAY